MTPAILTLAALLGNLFPSQPAAPAKAQAASAVSCEAGERACALSAAALERTRHQVRYEPAYVSIAYPMGDPPADTGVCADVVVRAYRAALDVDLQQRVHEDMRAHFSAYPKHWGLKRPDRNIDHRRVENLRVFFARHGESLPVSEDPAAYRPGDIVSWNLTPGGFLPHIGVVTEHKGPSGAPMIVHNIGAGPQLEDRLFDFSITGHYRYHPED